MRFLQPWGSGNTPYPCQIADLEYDGNNAPDDEQPWPFIQQYAEEFETVDYALGSLSKISLYRFHFA
jgi:hypothetical protein